MPRPSFSTFPGLALWVFAAIFFVSCSESGDDGRVGTSESDWPTFGRDLHHTRSNPVETEIGVDTVADLEMAWEHTGTEVTSTPAVVGGVVYFADWAGFIYAKNVLDGSEVWTTQLEDSGVTSSLAVGEERIFLGDRRGWFHAIDRATGDILWSVELDDHPNAGITGSPQMVDVMLDDGATDPILIVGVSSGELSTEKEEYTFRGSIVGIAQENGAERWRVYVTQDDETSGAGVSVWSSPSIDIERELAFIGTGQTYEEPASPMSDSLIAVDYRTGEIAWWRQFTENDVYRIFMPLPQGPDADIGAAPNLFTLDDGREVVGVGDKGGIYGVFDRATGEEMWVERLGPGSHLGGVMAPAAYHDGRIYITSNLWPSGFDTEAVFVPMFSDPENTSELIALEANDGTEVWRTSIASPTIGGTLFANGVVYSAHTLGLLQAFDARDGQLLWEDKVGESLASGPVVSDGLLFVTYGFSFIGIRGDTPGDPGGMRVYGLPQ